MSVPITSRGPRRGLDVLVSGTASDAHTWNLIFMQLYCEERGHRVTNLGPCVPDELLVSACRRDEPDLVMISSVNGHGFVDGLRAISAVHRHPDLAAVPMVIGGTLGTDGAPDPCRTAQLLAAGYRGVFDGGVLTAFDALLDELHRGAGKVAS